MNDFVVRIVAEMTELEKKFNALEKFIMSDKFKDLSDLEKFLLKEQFDVMEEYVRILNLRIKFYN